jgi:hypothetical protein
LLADPSWFDRSEHGLLNLDRLAAVQLQVPTHHVDLAAPLAPNVHAGCSEQDSLEFALPVDDGSITPAWL